MDQCAVSEVCYVGHVLAGEHVKADLGKSQEAHAAMATALGLKEGATVSEINGTVLAMKQGADQGASLAGKANCAENEEKDAPLQTSKKKLAHARARGAVKSATGGVILGFRVLESMVLDCVKFFISGE